VAKFSKTNRAPTGRNLPAVLGSFSVASAQCKVCQFPERRLIDNMLALGWTRAEVRRHWNDVIEAQSGEKDYFKKSSMENHALKHLSIQDSAVRRILERRAEMEGIDVEMIEGFIMTKTGVAEVLVHKGLESLQSGDTRVEPKEIIGAIETLIKLEEKRSVVAEEVMLREIRAFMKAVERNVDPELFEKIRADYRAELGEPERPAIPVSADIEDETEEE